ncbi:MAG: acetylxylan esterase [Spirochaetales bacterium]|nr:acetylxylan esterase [Spirochaetales bacterium]
MAQLDLPIDELKTYRGVNPCPDDLDEYWTKALEELETFPWNVNLQESSFQAPYADCYDLYFSGVGGARVYAKYIRPKKSPVPHPAVIEFHGYHGNSGDWSGKLKYAAAGFSVASMDCRGQGGKSRDRIEVAGPTLEGHIIRGLEDGPEKLMYRTHFLDTVQLARILMDFEEIDEKRIGVTGASQGGGLTLACAALEQRIKCAAPVYPFLSDYRRVWEMDLDLDAYAELRSYFRRYDPHHEREDDIFNTLGYIDVKNLAGRIKGKVFMGITMMDNICPPSTQFAAYNRIKSEKDCLIYHDYGHENLPGMDDRIFTFMVETLAR